MADTTVLIMAGGTGGHVFPALAVADVLLRPGVRVQWLGTVRGIEPDLVPKAGIPLHFISVAGLRGKGLRAQLLAPFQLARALWQSLQLIKRLHPDCVLGLGGFASGPGGLAAWLLRKPLIIHEQNAIAGTTNRVLAFFAKHVLLGYPHAIDSSKAEYVGNPVRTAIAQLPTPEQRWSERTGRMRVLVLGGSLGAQPINQVVPAAIAALPENMRPEIIHQTGRAHSNGVQDDYRALGIDARVEAVYRQHGCGIRVGRRGVVPRRCADGGRVGGRWRRRDSGAAATRDRRSPNAQRALVERTARRCVDSANRFYGGSSE